MKYVSGTTTSGGWGGIRTHETVARLPVFKAEISDRLDIDLYHDFR
jgi:hypothetical protein